MLAKSLARQAPSWAATASTSTQKAGNTVHHAVPSTSYAIHTSSSSRASGQPQRPATPSGTARQPIPPPGGKGKGPIGQNMSGPRHRKLLQQRRKENIELSELVKRKYEATKPDPVLGHQLNEVGYKYWRDSELCKVILTRDQIYGIKADVRGNLVPIDQGEDGTAPAGSSSENAPGPRRLNFGLDSPENRKLLFSDLPAVAVEDASRVLSKAHSSHELNQLVPKVESVETVERGNTDLLQRILDLRNASGKGIQVENIRRIREHFGTRPGDERPGMDTGSVETQVAVMTYRIRNIQEHLDESRHDHHNRRGMAGLVYQRMRLLKYLKRKSPERYAAILPRIGVEARAVEGEVVVPGMPKLSVEQS